MKRAMEGADFAVAAPSFERFAAPLQAGVPRTNVGWRTVDVHSAASTKSTFYFALSLVHLQGPDAEALHIRHTNKLVITCPPEPQTLSPVHVFVLVFNYVLAEVRLRGKVRARESGHWGAIPFRRCECPAGKRC